LIPLGGGENIPSQRRKVSMENERRNNYRRAWIYLFATFIGIYLLMGVLTMIAGKGGSAAWLKPLPLLLGPLIGMGVVRYRRQRSDRP
jgi:hypothetical protein